MQKARLSLLASQARLLACTSLCTHPHILQRHSGAFSTVTAPLLLHVGAHRNSSGFWSIQSSSQWWSHTPSSRLSTNSRPQGPTDSASSSSIADRKPHVPPAVAAGAAAAGDAASKAAKAAAKQVSLHTVRVVLQERPQHLTHDSKLAASGVGGKDHLFCLPCLCAGVSFGEACAVNLPVRSHPAAAVQHLAVTQCSHHSSICSSSNCR